MAQAAVAGCVVVLLASALLSAGRPASDAALFIGVLGIASVVGGLAWPLLWRWSPAGSLDHQAAQVEELAPELRGRLTTVVGRLKLLSGEEAALGRSTVLLERAAGQAAEVVAQVPPHTVHSATPTLRLAALSIAAMLCVAMAELLMPVGPTSALAASLSPGTAPAPTASEVAEVSPDAAVVGDIVLRYVFPDYTGIEAVEVPNSDGTIHAPVGTHVEIRARTDREYDGVSLQIDEREPTSATLVAGRDIRASLDVEGPGTWRLVLVDGEQLVASTDYQIVVEADAAPVVTFRSDPSGVAPVDRPLDVPWSVRDDFGVARVVVEVTQGEQTREVELRAPLDAPRELDGQVRLTPRDLGLAPGESAKLKVVAYDNDVMGGSKRGESPEFEVKVIGPRGQARAIQQHYEALRDAMIPVLAAFLVEEAPPPGGGLGVQAWVAEARPRFDPIRTLQRQRWGDEASAALDGPLVSEVLESGGRLIRFAVTTWDPSSSRRVTAGDERRFGDLHGEVVLALEQAITVLDTLLVNAALEQVARKAEDLASEAAELASRAADMEAAEILSRLDKLERMMAELAEATAQLNDGAMREFMNSQLQEQQNLMDQVRKAVAEGRLDDAREALAQLAEQMQRMSEGINDKLAAGQTSQDDLQQQADDTMEQLQQLEDDQRALADELEKKQEELGDGFEEQLEMWRELDRLANEADERGRGVVEATGDGRGWRVDSVRRLERLHERTRSVRDAVRARDLASSLERVRDAMRPADDAIRTVKLEATRDRMDETLPGGLDAAGADAARVREILDEMVELIEKLQQQQQADDPRVEQAAQEMAARQQELRERQKQLQQQLQQVERQMPTGNGEATEAMQRAGEAMDRAESALGEGDALEGEGHQREAAERLAEAREQLQSQQQQMQQMQQMQQQMREGQQQGQPRDDQRDGMSEQQVMDIPAPEDFRTPEEYRRALLEGMSGDVPEEYRAMKERYFEELVRQ